jgi:dephospho-CoA kinase
MSPAFTIGLTGGIGSGKTTVANMFADLGVALVDTDLIAHQLSAPGGAAIPALRAQFGAEFIQADGALDRAKMRAHVFAQASEKIRLEAILHPLIRSATEQAAAQAHGDYLIFVVPLLVESGSWKSRVSRVLVVDCPQELQISRVMTRSGLSEQQVRDIMRHQVSREQRLQAADDVILNDGDLTRISAQVGQLHASYLALSRTSPQT